MIQWLLNLFGLGSPARTRVRRRRSRKKRATTAEPDCSYEPTIASGPAQRNIVGEASYMKTLKRFMRSEEVRQSGEDWEVLDVHVELIREPKNRHDPNAIRVAVEDQTVGYIARSETADFIPLLDTLSARGLPAISRGVIVGKEGCYGVKLMLSAQLRLATDEPAIDGANRVALLGEEGHQDELIKLLTTQRMRRLVAEMRDVDGELHAYVEGALLGHLSRQMSERYRPEVMRMSGTGRRATCWLDLVEGARKVEAYVFLGSS